MELLGHNLEEKKKVTKPHDIITSRFSLTAREQDLITLAMIRVKSFADRTKVTEGQFDPNKPETLTNIETIWTYSDKEVADWFGITTKALKKKEANGKPFLFNVCESLIKKSKTIGMIESDDTWKIAGLISEAEYSNGVLKLEVTRTQAARMLDYGLSKNNFGIIDAKLLLGLKSGYAKRILEIISRFKNERNYQCSIGSLCNMLGTSLDDHTDTARFRRTVLDNPIAKLIASSDGVWSTQKGYPKGYVIDTGRGRKMTEQNVITFKMKYNEPKDQSTKDNQKLIDMSPDFLELIRIVKGAVAGELACLQHPEFGIEMVSYLMGMANEVKDLPKGTDNIVTYLELDPVELITLAGKAMMIALGTNSDFSLQDTE